MQAEIVAIGTELLLGHIIDTNSSWIARHLTTIGLNLYYTTTVGDNEARIVDVLRNAIKRSDVVITTGGLGPTVDDKTREVGGCGHGSRPGARRAIGRRDCGVFWPARLHHDVEQPQAGLPASRRARHPQSRWHGALLCCGTGRPRDHLPTRRAL